MTTMKKYEDYLRRLPAPGGGGAHRAIYGAGAFGCRAGLDQDVVCTDIRKNLPTGTRRVTDLEIEEGVRRAYADVTGKAPCKSPPAPRVAPGTLERLILEGKGATESDIQARSPIPLDWPENEGWRVLEALYGPGDFVFIGDDGWAGRIGETIRTAGEWSAALKEVRQVPCPKIMVNPVTGKPAPKKTGTGATLRGDGCIAAHRFVVIEHDQLDLASQLAYWRAAPLPVVALIFSGKKSIHGWVRVDCVDASEWETEIEQRLFPQYLVPMGFDPACRNSSRLSRMPGHRRADTGLVQRCLYLAPDGKAVAA